MTDEQYRNQRIKGFMRQYKPVIAFALGMAVCAALYVFIAWVLR